MVTSILSSQRNDVLPKNIIAANEKQVFYVKDESRQPTLKVELHRTKVMWSVWWDHYGIIHFELLNCNQTHNADSSAVICACVLASGINIVLLYGNARLHSARITQEKYWILGWSVLLHPSYIYWTLNQAISNFFALNKKFILTSTFLWKIRWKRLWKSCWALSYLNFTWEESTGYVINSKRWFKNVEYTIDWN